MSDSAGDACWATLYITGLRIATHDGVKVALWSVQLGYPSGGKTSCISRIILAILF